MIDSFGQGFDSPRLHTIIHHQKKPMTRKQTTIVKAIEEQIDEQIEAFEPDDQKQILEGVIELLTIRISPEIVD